MLDTKVIYMLNFVSSLASYNINLQHKTNFKNKKLRDLLRFQSVDGRHQPFTNVTLYIKSGIFRI